MDRRGRTHAQYRQGKAQLAFGEAANGRIVHVSTVANGSACDCVCPACGAPLVAREGTRTRHFAHKVDTACASARETVLHRLAKQILQDWKRLHLPAVVAEAKGVRRMAHPAQDFIFDGVEAEVRFGELIPDIVLRKGDRQLFVEIWVTHACDAEKLAKLRTTNVSTLEIDLRKTPRFATLKEVEDAVLQSAPRTWLVNPRLDAAREQVNAILAKREAARVAKLDRQAELLAAAWDRLSAHPSDGQRHFPLVRDARLVEELGHIELIGLSSKGDHAFTVEPLLWQAWLFKACLLSRPSGYGGEAGVTVRGALASMRQQGLVATMFMEDFEPDVLSRLRRLRPALRTPADLIQAYLKHLGKASMTASDGQRWRPSDATRIEFDTKIETAKAAKGRREELNGRAEALLRRAGAEAEQFDLPAWFETDLADGSGAPASAAANGGPAWKALKSAISTLEAAFYNDGETPDCLGLPLAKAIGAQVEARREAAARKKLEDEARIQAAAEARSALLTKRAAERLGPDAKAWLEACRKSDGATRVEAAKESQAVFDRLWAALDKAASEREVRVAQELRAAAARGELKRRASAVLGEDHAALFMKATHPALGMNPADYCMDDRTLNVCLSLLQSGRRRRR